MWPHRASDVTWTQRLESESLRTMCSLQICFVCHYHYLFWNNDLPSLLDHTHMGTLSYCSCFPFVELQVRCVLQRKQLSLTQNTVPKRALHCTYDEITCTSSGPRHGTTDWLKTGKVVWQGCILLPCLFNLNEEYIMRNARARWITSWNQDSWEKYQQPQICRWYHSETSDMQMVIF